MPSKKRKYEARFPPARIKKIMQTDEEIGKVAAAVPVIISRSLEIFLQSLVETTARYTGERKAKTMTTTHLKHCIEGERKFDFLKDLVSNIADISSKEEEEGGDSIAEKPKKQRKPRGHSTDSEEKRRSKESSDNEDESEGSSDDDEKSAPSTVGTSIPPISTPMPSVPFQHNSHSIDAIMGNTQSKQQPQAPTPPATPPLQQQHISLNQPLPTTMLPSFTSMYPSAPTIPSSMPVSMKISNNEDEDDDYDM